MNRIVIFFAFLIIGLSVRAQELNCGVKINAPSVRIVDPKVFKTLETAIFEFMNNRKWTDDKYQQLEKIECELIITITEELAIDRFKAQVNIQSSRPVFNSDYKTVLFNHADKDWEFSYAEFEALEYNENTNLSNLTSMLAYYAYIIIGFDGDSFASKGGTDAFLKAQNIVNNSQNISEKGWKPFESIRNRYHLVDQLLNGKYTDFRTAFYKYHREALDKFYEDQISPVKAMTKCLADLNKVHTSSPNSMVMQAFFNAKSDELVSIFASAPPMEKTKAIQILNRIDAGNTNKYRKILSSK